MEIKIVEILMEMEMVRTIGVILMVNKMVTLIKETKMVMVMEMPMKDLIMVY